MDASTVKPPRKPRRRVAVGPDRPRYLESRDLDKVMMMLVALMSEVSALRDRLDTHEALAEQGRNQTALEVEGYVLTEERARLRDERRGAMLNRIFRVLLEELEAGPLDEVEAKGESPT